MAGKKSKALDRRTFVLGAAGLGASMLAGGALGGCASGQGGASEDAPAPEESTALPNEHVETEKSSLPYDSVFPEHEPLGRGVGINPGRVVWMRDASAVTWDGSGFWWQREHFDADAVRRMVAEGVTNLAGEASPAEAWDALFRHHNGVRGLGGGYRTGERIAVKANMNGAGTNGADEDSAMSYTTPVLLARCCCRSSRTPAWLLTTSPCTTHAAYFRVT